MRVANHHFETPLSRELRGDLRQKSAAGRHPLIAVVCGKVSPIDTDHPFYLLCWPGGCPLRGASTPHSAPSLHIRKHPLRVHLVTRGNCTMKKHKIGSGVGYGHRTLKVEQLE